MNKILSAQIELAPQFYDIDAMNIVWHGHYVRYFEKVRSLLMDKIGYNYKDMAASNYVWPIVDMRLKYLKPIVLQQKILIKAALEEYENRLKINYKIYDKETDEVLTKGTTIQVAVDMDTNKMQLVTPSIFQKAVERALI